MSIEVLNGAEPRKSSPPVIGIPYVVDTVLRSSRFRVLARVVLTFMFWSSGLAKLIDYETGIGEMRHFGLQPELLYYVATVVTLLGGSLMVIINRWAWVGAGALAVFTALTIPIAHNFWDMEEPFRTIEFHVVMEHITVIGALLVVSYASAIRRRK